MFKSKTKGKVGHSEQSESTEIENQQKNYYNNYHVQVAQMQLKPKTQTGGWLHRLSNLRSSRSCLKCNLFKQYARGPSPQMIDLEQIRQT